LCHKFKHPRLDLKNLIMSVKRTLVTMTPSLRKRARVSKSPRKLIFKSVAVKRRRTSSKKTSKKARLRKTGLSTFGKLHSKQHVVLDRDAELWQTRQWSATSLGSIPKQTEPGGVMNKRIGNEVSIGGYLFKVNFKNNDSRVHRIYEYWVIPHNYSPENLTDAELQKNFFVMHGQATDNDRNWTNNLTTMLYDEPINPDKFTVLKKRVTMLGPGNVTTNMNPAGLRNWVNYSTYIPINRKYTYGAEVADTESALQPIQPPVVYISFCVTQMELASAPVIAALQREMHVVTFFRDGESGMAKK